MSRRAILGTILVSVVVMAVIGLTSGPLATAEQPDGGAVAKAPCGKDGCTCGCLEGKPCTCKDGAGCGDKCGKKCGDKKDAAAACGGCKGKDGAGCGGKCEGKCIDCTCGCKDGGVCTCTDGCKGKDGAGCGGKCGEKKDGAGCGGCSKDAAAPACSKDGGKGMGGCGGCGGKAAEPQS